MWKRWWKGDLMKAWVVIWQDPLKGIESCSYCVQLNILKIMIVKLCDVNTHAFRLIIFLCVFTVVFFIYKVKLTLAFSFLSCPAIVLVHPALWIVINVLLWHVVDLNPYCLLDVNFASVSLKCGFRGPLLRKWCEFCVQSFTCILMCSSQCHSHRQLHYIFRGTDIFLFTFNFAATGSAASALRKGRQATLLAQLSRCKFRRSRFVLALFLPLPYFNRATSGFSCTYEVKLIDNTLK